MHCKETTRSLLQKYDAGSYDDFLQHLLAVVPRRNVLVLNYADALGTPGSTRSTLRQITRHYGGPILDRTTSFPHTNTKVGAPAWPPPGPPPPPPPAYRRSVRRASTSSKRYTLTATHKPPAAAARRFLSWCGWTRKLPPSL